MKVKEIRELNVDDLKGKVGVCRTRSSGCGSRRRWASSTPRTRCARSGGNWRGSRRS